MVDAVTPSRRSRRLSGLGAEAVALDDPAPRRSARKASARKAPGKENALEPVAEKRATRSALKNKALDTATPLKNEGGTPEKAAPKRATRSALKHKALEAATPKKNAPEPRATRSALKNAPPPAEQTTPEKTVEKRVTTRSALKNAPPPPDRSTPEKAVEKRVTRSTLKKTKELPPLKNAPATAKKNVSFAPAPEPAAAAPDLASAWPSPLAVALVAVAAVAAGAYCGRGGVESLPALVAPAAAEVAKAAERSADLLRDLLATAKIARINLEAAVGGL